MNREELIAALRALAVAANSLRYNPEIDPDVAAIYEGILINLRDELCQEKATPPNPPLTLEELREMDGEPVWVVPLDGQEFEPPESDNYMEAQWMINYTWRWCDYDAERGNYGKTWLAYRRKPEEGTR